VYKGIELDVLFVCCDVVLLLQDGLGKQLLCCSVSHVINVATAETVNHADWVACWAGPCMKQRKIRLGQSFCFSSIGRKLEIRHQGYLQVFTGKAQELKQRQLELGCVR